MIPAMMPTGFMRGTTWNPADKSAGITLSNGNLTTSGNGGVRTTTSRNNGKLYLEFLCVSVAGNNTLLGISSGSSDGPSPPYTPTSPYNYWELNIGYGYTGKMVAGSFFGPFAYNSPYTAGDVVGLAWDALTGRIWWSKNNTWVGNPSAGTGAAFTDATGNLFAWSYTVSGSVPTLIVTSGSFSYTPPTGFSAWQP